MPRMKSEMYEQYLKIADKCGLTKLAEDSAELKKYKEDPSARAGSDTITTIEALYGVKPDGQEYEFNIMEQAHPNSVIIAPSYDKTNGLVENHNERHNIITNIVLKPTSGNNPNPKYAHKELILELVRIANEMDNKNKEELFKLADECLIGLQKEALTSDDVLNFFTDKAHDAGAIGEGALAGAGIGAAIGGLVTAWTGAGILAGVPIGAATGAVAGGVLAAITKTAPQVKNVELNCHELVSQLQDLHKKIPEGFFFFKKIDNATNVLATSAQEYQRALNTLKEHALSGQKTDLDAQATTSATKKFVENVKMVKDLHAEFTRRSDAGEFAKAQPNKALTPVYWFIDNDIEDVEDAFHALEGAIRKLEVSTQENVDTAVSKTPEATSPASVVAPSGMSVEKPQDSGSTLLKHLMSD